MDITQQIKEKVITSIADTFSSIINPEVFKTITFLGLGKALTDSKERKQIELQQKEDEDLIESFLVSYDEQDKRIARVILKNQLDSWYLRQPFVSGSKLLVMKISNGVIPYILKLQHIIGIQPLQGPVGLAYTLNCTLDDKSNIKGLEVISQAVEAGTRNLQASWTIEAMQDLKSQHGLDIESELSQVVSADIGYDIIIEVLNDLVVLASKNEITTLNCVQKTDKFISDTLKLLPVNINIIANEIAHKTRRGPGNFIITSPLGVSLLQGAGSSENPFQFVANPEKADICSLGYVGDICCNSNNKEESIPMYKVFSTLGLPGDGADAHFLIGYNGSEGIDTGYVYSPYIPVLSTGTIIDTNTFVPTIRLITRYGKSIRSSENSEISVSDSQNYYRLLKVKVDFS